MAGSVNKVVVDKYGVGMLSIPQVSAATGLPKSRVRKILIEEGVVLRTRTDGIRLRREVLGQHLKGKTREFTDAWRANISKGRGKWADDNAVGTTLKPSGYIEYTRGPNKGRSVHVVLMEERLGRRIHGDEVVHHIDGDRSNNAENNLSLMTRSAHTRLHRREQRLSKGETQ